MSVAPRRVAHTASMPRYPMVAPRHSVPMHPTAYMPSYDDYESSTRGTSSYMPFPSDYHEDPFATTRAMPPNFVPPHYNAPMGTRALPFYNENCGGILGMKPTACMPPMHPRMRQTSALQHPEANIRPTSAAPYSGLSSPKGNYASRSFSVNRPSLRPSSSLPRPLAFH